METIFQIFRDTILNHATLTSVPTQPTDIVNKAYVDNLPYVTGPSTSIIRQVPVFSNTTGNAFTNSTMTVDANGNANITKDLTVNGLTTFYGNVNVDSGYKITLGTTPTQPADVVNKQYVDSQLTTTIINYSGVGNPFQNSVVRWYTTNPQEITKSEVAISDDGLLVSPTISSISGYQLGGTTDPTTAGSFYLSRVGGTVSAPNVLNVGNTGYYNPVSTAGVKNIFIGTAIGSESSTQSGTSNNVVIGNGIMTSPSGNSIPIGNVFIGNEMASKVTLANYNVIIGYESGSEIIDGVNNVLIGKSAGKLVSGGDNNVFLGIGSGQTVDSGSNNVFIGVEVGTNQAMPFGLGQLPHTGANSSICIGYHSDTNNSSNSITLGTNARSVGDGCFTIGAAPGPGVIGTISKWNCKGLTGMGAGATMIFDTITGDINYNSSSKRYKTNISESIDFDTSRIYELQPKSFTWISNGKRDYGLIAEDVVEIIPELVLFNTDGNPETINYNGISILLLNEIKRLKQENQNLQTSINEQKNINIVLEQRLTDIENKIW